jgi:RNA polymerase sigma-70 factor (ECF subfamily)
VLKLKRNKNEAGCLEGVTDGELFDRFRTGDNSSFSELFRRHNPKLFLYCVKILGNRQSAEDMTQEAWEKVIELRANTETEVRNPSGFLLRIARNLCIDHLRKNKRMITTDEIDESATPMFATPQQGELEEIAVAALDHLPYDYREVLILNLYCGYRYDEIASMLDRTPDTQLRRIVAASMEPLEGTPQTGAADKPMHQRKTDR